MASNQKAFDPRTARKANNDGPFYVVVEGAPKHYVPGYSLVGPGSIVTLAVGVTPGKHLVEVSAEDAAKAGSDEAHAQRLAVQAKAKADAKRNDKDVVRKVGLDQAAQEQLDAQRIADAQKLSDALERANTAERNAKDQQDALATAEANAKSLQEQLDRSNEELAKLQKSEPAKADAAKPGTK